MKLPSARGLQVEIVASLFVVMLAGLTIVAVVMASLAVQTTGRSALDQLRAEAGHLARTRTVGSLRLGDLAAYTATLRSGAARVSWRVLDDAGHAVGAGRSDDWASEEIAPLLERARRDGRALQGGSPFGPDLLLLARLPARAGESGWLLGRVRSEVLRAQLSPLLRSGGWVLASAAAVFVAFGAYLLRGRIVLPVRTLERATRRVADGDLSTRTPATGSDELADLARGFNRMTEALARDREALTRAHESLSRNQRLATVGQLAAGVAHEVGNPVAAVLNYAELLLRDDGLSERSREAGERIRSESLRVRSLVRELLDLARGGSAELGPQSAGELLERAAERMRPQKLLDQIELEVFVASDLPTVLTAAARVEQILVNLIENAAHAVADCEEPSIELRAEAGVASWRTRRRDDEPQGAVELSVSDNGTGIAPEDQPHVFDPFFTTKEQGLGTGLGLWNAHRLAELLGARLELESAPGRTTFRLLLPLTDTGDGEVCDGSAENPDHR